MASDYLNTDLLQQQESCNTAIFPLAYYALQNEKKSSKRGAKQVVWNGCSQIWERYIALRQHQQEEENI